MRRAAKISRFLFIASRFQMVSLGLLPGKRTTRRDRSNRAIPRAKGINPGPGLWISSRESLKDSPMTSPAKMEKIMAASLSGWILIRCPSLLVGDFRSAAQRTERENLPRTLYFGATLKPRPSTSSRVLIFSVFSHSANGLWPR